MSRHPISIPTVVLAAEETIEVVIPPGELSRDESNVLLACLISTLRTVPAGYLEAVELVYNIMQIALPGLRGQLGEIKALKVETKRPDRKSILAWVGLNEQGDNGGEVELPSLPGPVAAEAKAITGVVPVYAAIASILLALGRQASESAATAALDKRPDALIRRFTITEGDRSLLPGREGGPSRESLELLYNAFSVYTEIRGEIIRYFIGVQRGNLHYTLPMEIVMTNFALMKGAGMTHVEAILKLAKIHPWTLKVPQLGPYWDKFVQDLSEFNKVEEDVRPYHRLLVPQSAFLFLSPPLAPLIAVAGHFIKEVEKTFANYVYRAADHAELLDIVDRYAPGYIPTKEVNTLATLLGVADVPLPKLRDTKMATTQQEEVV